MNSIEIKKIGITKLDTDAIVNAANEGSAEMLRLFSSMDERTKEIMLIQMRALVSAKR